MGDEPEIPESLFEKPDGSLVAKIEPAEDALPDSVLVEDSEPPPRLTPSSGAFFVGLVEWWKGRSVKARRWSIAIAILVLLWAIGSSASHNNDSANSSVTSHAPSPPQTTRERSPAARALAQAGTPDPELTPGASSTTVTPETIGATICAVGWTDTVRDVSETTRARMFKRYGVTQTQSSKYVTDHLIPLELGGLNTLANLWPEPVDNSYSKDTAEDALNAEVCAGRIGLADAQHAIASDWEQAGQLAADSKAKADAALQGFFRGQEQKRLDAYYVAVQAGKDAEAARQRAAQNSGGGDGATPGGGAMALCNDGAYSYAAHHQGACSHHGGVAVFYR